MAIVAATAQRSALAFPADPAELRSVERVVSFARVLVAMTAVAVMGVYPLEPSAFRGVTTGLLFAYALVAITLLALVVSSSKLPGWLPLAAHITDIGFCALLTLFSSGPNSPLFTLLLYPLIAAAYRWGFREVMITAAVIDALLVLEAVAAVMEGYQFERSTLLFRTMFVAALGASVAYLAENEKRRRFEARAISLVLVRGRAGGKLSDAVLAVLSATRDVFKARQALLVTREKASGRAFLWTGSALADEGAQPVELPPAVQGDYLFPTVGAAWHAAARSLTGKPGFSVVAVDEAGQGIPSKGLILPPGFLHAHQCQRMLVVEAALDDEWQARALLIDPALGVRREQNARFVLNIASNVAPALYDHYRVRWVRTRAQAIERRRIARELHDGVTQSLLGLEMEVVVLHRSAMSQAPQLADDLVRIHRIVRNEITAVRELMEGVRVVDIDSGDLLRHLSDVVDRFGRYTGISARFIASGPPVTLAPHLRREIARIVHEALVNVRKHSGADRVTVRVDVEDRSWKLTVEDDGRGFWFAGRRSQEELGQLRQGPVTISERARSIGAVMTVESRPGFGAKVEVELALQAEAAQPRDVHVS